MTQSSPITSLMTEMFHLHDLYVRAAGVGLPLRCRAADDSDLQGLKIVIRDLLFVVFQSC